MNPFRTSGTSTQHLFNIPQDLFNSFHADPKPEAPKSKRHSHRELDMA
jgi:hypothetical protein